VSDTGGKWEKSSITKVLIILFVHLWEVEFTYRYIFAFKLTLGAAWYYSHYLPPVLLTPAANLPPVSLTPVANCQGINDTVGKFATGVNDTSGKIWNNIRLKTP
jgi:hypothetical protein